MNRRARMLKGVATAAVIAAIPALIVTSLVDGRGLWITAVGVTAAIAALVLIVVGAVTERPAGTEPEAGFDEELAAAVEHQVENLIEAGVDEDRLRDLVRDAVAMAAAKSR